jgi:hypothetical protein
LAPPADWQVFEDLCRDLWSMLWNDPNAQKHGRSGQAQQGVDVYGRPDQGPIWAGVQCRLKDRRTAGTLTSPEIEGLIEEARRFEPPLGQFIIATTAPRDAQLQAAVRRIDDRERQAGSFSVAVVFWDDIESRLSGFPELLRKYYPVHFPRLDQPAGSSGADAGIPSRLEVIVDPNPELDWFALLPAYSTTDPAKSPDLTVLTVALSHIEIINHDDSPTEVLRLWVVFEDEVPREIMEEELLPETRRIEARSRRRYELKFTAAFLGAPPSHRRDRVWLCVKTIGLGELRIRLEELFRDQVVDSGPDGEGATLGMGP